MLPSPLRISLVIVLLAVAPSFALAQAAPADPKAPPPKAPPPKPDPNAGRDDYRQFFKKPETVPEFWRALKFELEVGRYDLAARHLRGLLDQKPEEKDLLALYEKEGLSAFLRLRNIDWADPKKGLGGPEADQARKDVEDLIGQATAAAKKFLSDPERITRFVKNLGGTEEEKAFAVKELYRSGPAAVPHLIDALVAATGDERDGILHALAKLGPDAAPPLLAAVDMDDPATLTDLVGVLEMRGDPAAVPELWYLSGDPRRPVGLRNRARDALAKLLQVPRPNLPSAKEALTREAERYFQHQVRFLDPGAVTVWRWDGKQVVPGWPGAPTVSTSKAEEYYGLRYARQALAIDPEYQPAQLVFLSLALEKGMERAGPSQPLAKSEPEVHALLASVNPDLLLAALERGLADQNLPVILGSTRALGEVAETRAARPLARGAPAVVRALYYPNRRIHLAAAEALLRIPPPPDPPPAKANQAAALPRSRVVEVLRRAAAAEPPSMAAPRVLVGHVAADARAAIGEALTKAGFEPVPVASGRDILRRLGQAADVEAVLLDAALPDPGLAALLGQLRADVNYGLLPVLIAGPPVTQEDLRKQRLAVQVELDSLPRRRTGLPELQELRDRTERDLNRAKADQQEAILKDLKAVEARLNALSIEHENFLLRERKRIDQALLTAAPEAREESLRRLAERYRNVHIVPAGLFLDPEGLKRILPVLITEAVGPPLSEAELKENAEQSLAWLGRMARGELPGYDVRPAGDTVLDVLRAGKVAPEAQAAAVDVAGRLAGARPQAELANVVLDGNRPLPLRNAAAQELVRHVQKFGPLLTDNFVRGLEELTASQTADAGLKANVVLVMGSMRPDAKQTGDRLKEFRPAPPAPPAPPPAPPPAEPPKDK